MEASDYDTEAQAMIWRPQAIIRRPQAMHTEALGHDTEAHPMIRRLRP